MSLDINTGKLRRNAFRVTKKRNITASRIRIPGGHVDGKTLVEISKIAEKYGDGTVHLTSRQGFEITGIPFEKMEEVNLALQPIIDNLNIPQEKKGGGYPEAGTRNIVACIGNRVCPYACYDTTAFAQKIEQSVFPHDLHFKIGLTGCPNDCAKVRMQDFGIIGMTEPQLDKSRCVTCRACEKNCKKKSVEAIHMVQGKPDRNAEKCIGCGVCVLSCPMRAWTRSQKKYYKLTLFGRTGKQNPRLGQDWIEWINLYSFCN